MLQLYSFDSGYSLDVLGKEFLSMCGGEGEGERGLVLQKYQIPEHSFPSFYYHEINSIFEQLFCLCFRETKSGRGGLFFRMQNGAFCCILDIKSV